MFIFCFNFGSGIEHTNNWLRYSGFVLMRKSLADNAYTANIEFWLAIDMKVINNTNTLGATAAGSTALLCTLANHFMTYVWKCNPKI